MDTFPPTKRLKFLLEGDTRLSQFSLDLARATFIFANGCKIECKQAFRMVDSQGAETRYELLSQLPYGPPMSVHTLLEKALKTVTSKHLTLTLTFEGDELLEIESEIGPFESGQIVGPHGFIVF